MPGIMTFLAPTTSAMRVAASGPPPPNPARVVVSSIGIIALRLSAILPTQAVNICCRA